MVTLYAMQEFFGWCSVINILVVVVATICLTYFRSSVSSFHGRMFDLEERDLSRAYIRFFGQYKVAIIVLNLVPYFALVFIGG